MTGTYKGTPLKNLPTIQKGELTQWFYRNRGQMYWRGKEIPIWDPGNPPKQVINRRNTYWDSPNELRFESNHLFRMDYVAERKGIVYICETDPRPFHSSIGQLLTYKHWIKGCHQWANGKMIKLMLFVRETDSIIEPAAKSAGIKIIELKPLQVNKWEPWEKKKKISSRTRAYLNKIQK